MYRQISEIQPAGIEPASLAWKASILPLNHGCFIWGGEGQWVNQIFIYTNFYRIISLYGFGCQDDKCQHSKLVDYAYSIQVPIYI